MKFKTILFFLMLASITVLRAGEKAYLHLDNSAYFLGDTIRMAAYVMDTDTKRLTNKSKVLYVEMLAPEGYVVEKRTYPLVEGKCVGDIVLHPLLLSGLYEVRAYTRYMLNDGNTNCFSKVVPVYESVKFGDYSSLAMRKRSLRNGEKNSGANRVAKKNADNLQQSLDKVQGETLKVIASYDMANLQPFFLVTLKLKGQPGGNLSLSVVDGDNYIHTTSSDITDLGSSQVIPSSNHSGVNVAPEKGITIYGKAGKLNNSNGVFSFESLPNQPLAPHLFFSNGYSVPKAETDAEGKFSMYLGDFMGDAGLQLKFLNLTDTSVHTKFVVDDSVVPSLRNYTKEELYLQKNVLMGDLGKLKVTQRNMPKSYFSVIRLDLIKEIDRLINEDENAPTAEIPSLLVNCQLLAEPYPKNKLKRIMAIALSDGNLEEKAMPKGYVVNNFTNVKNFKDIVIRSDQAIRKTYAAPTQIVNAYSFLNVTPTANVSTGGAGTTKISVSNCSNISYPSIVCCMTFDTNHEWEKYIKYNRTPQSRYLKVSGFSTQLPYRLPNYSKSHPQADYRRTLYWNPSVQLDANGEATIQFFNNGTCKKFVISGEGVSEDGKAIVCNQSL